MLIRACSFAQAHLYAVNRILTQGDHLPTDYDKPDEPSSLDLPLMIEVLEPWNPPIFSKCVWDSAEGLLAYRDEVLYGTRDSLKRYTSYTYHDRLQIEDQLFFMTEELRRNAYSRRAQAITWIPREDQRSEYPPCLQRVWARIRDGSLDFHTHWRSRDMLKAWGSNAFAFAHWHKVFAENLEVPIGVYREFIDSAHIYGRDIERAKAMIERPFEKLEWPLSEIERESCNEGVLG